MAQCPPSRMKAKRAPRCRRSLIILDCKFLNHLNLSLVIPTSLHSFYPLTGSRRTCIWNLRKSHHVAWILLFNFGQFRPRYVHLAAPIVVDGSGTSSDISTNSTSRECAYGLRFKPVRHVRQLPLSLPTEPFHVHIGTELPLFSPGGL
jgi:hypothetical protein